MAKRKIQPKSRYVDHDILLRSLAITGGQVAQHADWVEGEEIVFSDPNTPLERLKNKALKLAFVALIDDINRFCKEYGIASPFPQNKKK